MLLFLELDIILFTYLVGLVLMWPAMTLAVAEEFEHYTWKDTVSTLLAGLMNALVWPWWLTYQLVERIR